MDFTFLGKQNRITACLCSLLFTLFLLLGIWLRGAAPFRVMLPRLLLLGLLSLFCCLILLYGILTLRDRFAEKQSPVPHGHLTLHRLQWFCLFLLCDLPAFFALYPGIFGYDGPTEMMQLFGLNGNVMTAQHTLAHIYLLGGILQLGRWLSGSYSFGLILYGLLQAIVLAAVFTEVLLWMQKRGCGRILLIVSFCFLALHPVLQMMTFNTTKDTLYSAFFLFFLTRLTDLTQAPDTTPAVPFCISAVLLCCFRKQGVFLLAFLLLAALLWFRTKKVLLLLAASFCLGYLLMGPLVNLTGIPQGDPREMLSVPMEQVACVYLADAQGAALLNAQERAEIEALIPRNNLLACNLVSVDAVKSGFRTPVLQAHFSEYLSLYVHLGLRYPEIYLRSFCGLLSGYFDLFSPLPVRHLMYENTYADFHVLGLTRHSLLPVYAGYLRAVSRVQGLPAILLGAAWPAWLMLLTLTDTIVRKRRTCLLPCLLLFGQWGIQLLSPVALLRYAVPLLVCVPVLLHFLLTPQPLHLNH